MNNIDRLGRDSIFYSIVDKKNDEVLQMINDLTDVNFQDNDGNSYLHVAVQSNSINIVERLLEKGAIIDIKDKYGKTPLMVAISSYNGNEELIKLLIKKGADKNEKANSGISCMKLAEMKGVLI